MGMANRKTAGGPSKAKARNAKRQAHLKAVQDVIEDAFPEETLIARWAEQASTGTILCRQFKHEFPDEQLLRLYRINATYSMRELECRRCHTKRTDLVVNGSLQVVSRSYDYVVGYQRDKGADGSQRLPRYAVAEALESRVDVLAPPAHIQEAFRKLGSRAY